MLELDEYIRMAERVHGHVCAGQIVGLRLALYGLKLLGIQDPTGTDRKRLITYVVHRIHSPERRLACGDWINGRSFFH